MANSLRNTSWPSKVVSDAARNLIGQFFTLVDQKSTEANRELGYKVFSSNGIMIAAGGRAEGSQAIEKSREHAWDVITTRKHEVIKVYTSDDQGLDVLLIGKLTAGVADGKSTEVEFVARITMEQTQDGLRIMLYQTWVDPNPLAKLVKG